MVPGGNNVLRVVAGRQEVALIRTSFSQGGQESPKNSIAWRNYPHEVSNLLVLVPAK